MNKISMINGPTLLTIFRIILTLPFVIFCSLDGQIFKILALITFIIAAITDFIDGHWARRCNIVTNLGAFLDPLADKMLVNLAFLVLVQLGIIPLWVFAIILVRDFAVDGIRMLAAKQQVTIAASIYGKSKTTMQMLALAMLLFSLTIESHLSSIIGGVLLYIAFALTVFSGIDYLVKNRRFLLLN